MLNEQTLDEMLAGLNDTEQAVLPDSSKMSDLTSMLSLMREMEKQIEEKTAELSGIIENYRKLSEETVPDMFDAIGLSKISMSDKTEVKIDRKFVASISKTNQDFCFDWLRKNGHGAIIKNEIKVELGKGSDEDARALRELLSECQIPHEDKISVHPQTLAAFVNEQLKKGEEIPEKEFGVFPVRKTKISGSKFKIPKID